MVQNKSGTDTVKSRGRPKAYDRPTALKAMRNVFWQHGFAATSLDDLSAATAMNRPSLYNAFGDKSQAFKAVLDDYADEVRVIYTVAFTSEGTLRETLERVYEVALGIYAIDMEHGRGCFMTAAALTDSLRDGDVGAKILGGIYDLDKAYRWRFKLARDKGELPADTDTGALAMVASAVHSALSVRMRAGESFVDLRRLIAQTVTILCG